MNHKTMTTHWGMYWLFSVFSMSLYWYFDSRPLVDLGRYYQSIPDWWLWVEQPSIQMFWGLLSQLGGWLNAMLAIGVWLFSDPELVFMFYAVMTSGLFWWGLRDAPIWTGVFVLMQPIWQVGWRTQWIHALETSLILLVWQSWRSDRINKWTGVVSMLAVWLRPSALIWLGVLWVLDCLQNREDRQHHWLLAGMLVGVLLITPQLGLYVSGKLAVPRVDGVLWDELGRHGGWIQTLIMMFLIASNRKMFQRRDWVLVVWILGGVGLATLFGVGIDNFPLIFVGLAVLAGYTRPSRLYSRGLIALMLVLNTVPFINSVPELLTYGLHPNSIYDTEYDFQRPIHQVTAYPSPTDVQRILEQVCAHKHPHCLVVTSGALFHPHRESQGRLALLSMEVKHLRLEKSELWFRRNEQLRFVHAAIVQDCDANDVWLHQFHRFAKEFENHIENWKIVESVTVGQCRWRVLTPKGQ